MCDGLQTLPTYSFPQPPPGSPTELGELGHREAQNSRRRGGGNPPPDGLLLPRVAEEWSDPRGRLPQERQELLQRWKQEDQLSTHPKRGLRQASAVPWWGSQPEGQAEIQQNQRRKQPNKSRRLIGLKERTHQSFVVTHVAV